MRQSTMSGSRLEGRRRSAVLPPRVISLALVIVTLAGGGTSIRTVRGAAMEDKLFRCEREEDLDGSACRVDMLPDEALAEMVYER